MTTNRWQFSLRTLLIAATTFAVLMAIVANFADIVIGLVMLAIGIGFWIGCYFAPFKEDLEGPETSEQRRKRLSEISED
jgi:hypothetical protein